VRGQRRHTGHAAAPPPLPSPSGGGRKIVHGFSLLEILVAFAIAALALGLLYQVTGNNARQAGGLGQHERAMMLAESLLAAYPTVPAQGLSESAETAGFAWRVESHPYPTPADSATQATHLHEILVSVRWLDGNAERSFDLTTLRPERLPQAGGTLR